MIATLRAFVLSALIITLSGCVCYSPTGAGSIDAETFSVQFFRNNAANVNPTLSQVFTEKLRDKFLNNTSLRMVQQDGDFAFDGYITDYTTAPLAVEADQAALTRLTIRVKVIFDHKNDPDKSFERTFQAYDDYDANLPLSDVEAEKIDIITDQLILDIFNATALDW